MGELSEDLHFEILARLPVKSLGRFKCVCKKWHSLISNPLFVKSHLKMSMQENAKSRHWFLLINIGKPIYSVNYEGLMEANAKNTYINEMCHPVQVPSYVDIAGSCDGLVCSLVNFHEGYILWNPSTGEGRKLPPSSLPSEFHWHFSGLGYDSSVEDYKFIVGYYPTFHVIDRPGVAQTTVEMFTLKSNSWKSVEYDLDASMDDLYFPGVYCNGYLHWILKPRSETIGSFNLAEEKFYNIITLPSVGQNFDTYRMGVVGGCLFVVFTDPGDDMIHQHYEAWIMKEYGNMSSWIKLCSFSRNVLPTRETYVPLVAVSRAGKVILNCGWGEFCIYEPEENAARLLKLPNVADCYETTFFVESLVSPYGIM